MSAIGADLLAGLSLTESEDGTLRAPNSTLGGDVVFGGQMLGQAIVAATRRMPTKQVKSVQMIFARSALVTAPVDVVVEPMHEGRNIGSSTVDFVQNQHLCARALVLLDVGETDLVRHQVTMPIVGPPDGSKARPHAAAAPETIIVGDVDVHDPSLTGPPTLQMWVRFAEASDDATVARALLAHATDGWLIATAMRPHAGLGQAMAHRELATGVLSHALTFHGDFDAREWLLIDHESLAAGGGRTYGRGHVFTEDGRLVASFVQEGLLRLAPQGPRSGDDGGDRTARQEP